MIVDGECLYQRIVIPKLVLYGIDKLIKRPLARLPTFAAAMWRKSKRHIVVSTAQGSRLAVVVIASGHESPMDLRYESLIKGIVVRERGDPAIGLNSRIRLSLRTCQKLFGRRISFQSDIQLALREISTLDSRGASHLAFQLNLLKGVYPVPLIRSGR
jgi:hypothetical protein